MPNFSYQLLNYAEALWHYWWLLAGGAVMTALGIYERYRNANIPWRNFVYVGLLFFFVASFMAWRGAFQEAEAARAETRDAKIEARQRADALNSREIELNHARAEADSLRSRGPVPIYINIPKGSVAVAPAASDGAPVPTTSDKIRFTQSQVPSGEKEFPYIQRVVIQTTVTIPRAFINIYCSGPVAFGEITAGIDYGGASGVSRAVMPGRPEIFVLSVFDPPLVPERPLIVELYSVNPISVKSIVVPDF